MHNYQKKIDQSQKNHKRLICSVFVIFPYINRKNEKKKYVMIKKKNCLKQIVRDHFRRN